jgi:hypothetical protein
MVAMRIAAVVAVAAIGCASKDGRVDDLRKRIEALEQSDKEVRALADKKFDAVVQNLVFAGIVGADGKAAANWWCAPSGCFRDEKACQRQETLEAAEIAAVRKKDVVPGECLPFGAVYCHLIQGAGRDIGVSPMECRPTLSGCERSDLAGVVAPCVRVQ